jgi:hypothetical protein
MLRTYQINVNWDGGNTRKDPASLTVEYLSGNDLFDTSHGAYFKVRPGGGDWFEVEAIKSVVIDEKKFSIYWSRTGGQNHDIWLVLKKNVNESEIQITQSGPINIKAHIMDVPLDT